LNILFIISSLRHGGAEKQAVSDANMLSGNNKIILLTFKGGELNSLVSKDVKLIELKKEGYLKTAKKLRKIIIDENIQVVNASLFAAMILSVMAADKINIPVIWHFHSHEYDIEFKSRLAFNYFAKKNCLKKILFVSWELMEYVTKKGFKFSEGKKEILYNNYTVKDASNRERIEKGIIKIGYIGRLVKLKRIEYLIELAEYLAYRKIDNFEIEIAGDGEMRGELEKSASESKYADKIKFAGFQSDVEKYYNAFEIFVLPSEEECLSISLIDACVKGLPCVAFDVGGNNEIIKEGEGGYLVKSKEEFFDKIYLLVTDEEKRLKIGNFAKEYCTEKFKITKRKEKLENIFKECQA